MEQDRYYVGRLEISKMWTCQETQYIYSKIYVHHQELDHVELTCKLLRAASDSKATALHLRSSGKAGDRQVGLGGNVYQLSPRVWTCHRISNKGCLPLTQLGSSTNTPKTRREALSTTRSPFVGPLHGFHGGIEADDGGV